jgi:hypothetical protein
MIKKTYADQCLERAQRGYPVYLSAQKNIAELARRLKRAIEMLRDNDDGTGIQTQLADSLEAMPEDK